ncbi:aKG-HExxH-type peptide beta-hydroxylase [Kribbella alba]|uniref:aKG-HExxH-type peptide beta-hydroxylase n=1 Tax=Kribbella alba TaxID=190197 RepID=UPI0031E3786F
MDALTWSDDAALARRLNREFVARVREQLAQQAPVDVLDALAELPVATRRRLELAPEVTRRVLFEDPPPPELGPFLRGAIAFEEGNARRGAWSALGDAWIGSTRTIDRWPQIPDAPPLDFGSPWATRIDLTGRHEFANQHRPPPRAADAAEVHERLTRAWDVIGALSPTIADFVRSSTNVIVIQTDANAPQQVSSGTNGIYVGRTFITNAHVEGATTEALMEAIVHESIHGLLQRDVLDNPFVPGAGDDETPAVASPWTGRPLPVRAFLEASFVWFGLVQLWAQACAAADSEAVEPTEARRRLLRAVRGFVDGSLVDRLACWREDVRSDLVPLLDAMQEGVLRAAGALA